MIFYASKTRMLKVEVFRGSWGSNSARVVLRSFSESKAMKEELLAKLIPGVEHCF